MNERFGNVQYDYGNQAKFLQMISNQDTAYSLSTKSNTNTNLVMPSNNSNYIIENLPSNMQGASINNYGIDFTNRSMDLYNNSNKFNQNVRQQTSNIERSNLLNRYSNLVSNSINGGKYGQHGMGNDHQRMFPGNMGLNSMHSLHIALANNNHSNNNNSTNQILGSPSMIHKSIDSDLLIAKKEMQRNMPKNIPSTMFYTQSNLKSVSQLQRDNELENPKWIVFPPVLQSAIQLRQGKQHLAHSKVVENAITVDEELKKTLLDRISACLVSVNSKNGSSKTPDTILQYTDITPIEATYEIRKSKTFNRPSICYKAFDTTTEQFVLLRRFPNLVLQSAKDHQLLSRYHKIKHPGLIPITNLFVTEAFEDHSTVFIMAYCPCSVTALMTHVSDVSKLIGFASPFNTTQQARPYSSSKKASDLNMLSEEKSWCYLIQLINIVRYVHNILGMYCKIIDPSKILIQYPDRIRLNCYGLIEFLSDDSSIGSSRDDPNDLVTLQARDLETLGQFMLCVICGTTIALQENDSNIAFELLQRFYSNNLRTTVVKLIRSEFQSINEVATSTFAECYNHVTKMYIQMDYLEFNLMKELECGRLFRLVCKLATICERNELGMDSNWSDYGANYQLKLFRDFVFHQVDSNGAPYLDLAHIVTCLNKLDAGSTENVCLISRDGLNMFCVTFADLKQVLDESFEQLISHKNDSISDAIVTNQTIN